MWPPRAVLQEIGLTLRAEGWRAALLVIAAACLVASAVITDEAEIQRVIALDQAMDAAGRDVLIASSASPGANLNGPACLALNDNPAVLAAGGMTEGERLRIAKAPGEFMAATYLTGDTQRVITGTAQGPLLGAGLSVTAANRIGVGNASVIRLGDAAEGVPVTVLDVERRLTSPGAWVFLPGLPQMPVTQCWVELHPWAREAGPDLVAAALADRTSIPQVVTLLSADQFASSPLAQFEQRPTRLLWLAAGAVLGCGIGVLLWFRRAEVALLRTVGSGWPQAVLVYASHQIILVWLGASLGAISGAYVAALAQGDVTAGTLRTALTVSVGAGTAATILVVGMTAVASAGSTAKQIRDRL